MFVVLEEKTDHLPFILKGPESGRMRSAQVCSGLSCGCSCASCCFSFCSSGPLLESVSGFILGLSAERANRKHTLLFCWTWRHTCFLLGSRTEGAVKLDGRKRRREEDWGGTRSNSPVTTPPRTAASVLPRPESGPGRVRTLGMSPPEATGSMLAWAAEDRAARMGFLHQLQLLLWKNISLKRRGPVSPAAAVRGQRGRPGGTGSKRPQREAARTAQPWGANRLLCGRMSDWSD